MAFQRLDTPTLAAQPSPRTGIPVSQVEHGMSAIDPIAHMEMEQMMRERRVPEQSETAKVLPAPGFRLPEPVLDSSYKIVHRRGKAFDVNSSEVCPECTTVSLVVEKGEQFCMHCGLVVGIEGINIRTEAPNNVLRSGRRVVEEETPLFGNGYRVHEFMNTEALPKEQNDW